MNFWRRPSGLAGTLCVIRTVTRSRAGSTQKIVPAVPSQPYSPRADPPAIATLTLARPQPIVPGRASSTTGGRPLAVIRATVSAESSRTSSRIPPLSSICAKRRKSGTVETRPTAPSMSAGRAVKGSVSIRTALSPPPSAGPYTVARRETASGGTQNPVLRMPSGSRTRSARNLSNGMPDQTSTSRPSTVVDSL